MSDYQLANNNMANGKKPRAGVLKTKGMSAREKMKRISKSTARKAPKVR